jgi:uncharacterized protein YjbI with pentapeptide repeats
MPSKMTKPISSAEVLAAYALGKRSFASLDFGEEIHNFENAMLAGADFSNTFICACFRGANLERATFKNANVKTCDFSNTELSGASFEGAAIDGAVFIGANLKGASFAGATEQGYIYQDGEIPT